MESAPVASWGAHNDRPTPMKSTPAIRPRHFRGINIIQTMRLSFGSDVRSHLAVAALPLVLALGCQSPAPPKDAVLQGYQSVEGPEQRVPINPGQPSDSAVAPTRAAVTHPNIQVAAQLVAAGSFLDAEIVLSAILREQPECAQAKFLLGVVYLKSQRAARALPLLQASLDSRQAFTGRSHVEHFIGWTNYQLGELDAAKRAFQSHVAAVPTADDSYYGLAVIALDEDRVADAQQALERALELVGSSPRRQRDRAKILARLGDIEFRADRPEPAVALFEESLQLYPDHAEVWGKLARALDRLGRTDAATDARAKQAEAQARGDARGRGEAE